MPHGWCYNLGSLSEHILDRAIGRYIDHFSCLFHLSFAVFPTAFVQSVSTSVVGSPSKFAKCVQISYSQKFPTKWAWNIMEYFLNFFLQKS